MKTNFKLKNGLGGQLLSAGAALFLLGGVAAVGQPFSSPEGTWDVIMSGPRDGVALMTFESDNTISMIEILIPKAKGGAVGDRGYGSRDGSAGTNSLPAHTNIFGGLSFPSSDFLYTNTDVGSSIEGSAINVHSGEAGGQWGFDGSGRVIGFFTEVSAYSAIITNLVPLGTNTPPTPPGHFTDGITLTNPVARFLTNVTFQRFTNAISFTGKVKPGSKLNLVCSTPDGKATFTGVPPLALTNISGSWFGTLTHEGLPYTEFFDLSSSDPALNLYGIDGAGPGYTYGGMVIVSKQKKIGFVIGHDVAPEAPRIVRAVYGSMDLKHVKFTGKGLENRGSGELDRVTFKTARSSAPVE